MKKAKLYTPIDLANHCWDKVSDVIGFGNISEAIEPSVGGGAFLHHSDFSPSLAYDILPDWQSDNRTEVFTQDFLKLDLPYKRGRLFIGNPPFGDRNNLLCAFYNKAVSKGDFIAFILPISQLNNAISLYKFDLVYSEVLGLANYSGTNLHCCFNIYRRPTIGVVNQKPCITLKDVTIIWYDTSGYGEQDYDVRMCYWDNGSAGRILGDDESYSPEYKIKVNNPTLKERAIRVLTSFDWCGHLKNNSMRTISQYQVYQILSLAILEIQ